MELFFTLLTLAALAGFAVLLVRRGLLAAPLAPFAALCGTILWFSLGGCLGILRAAGWAWFFLAAAAWGVSLWPKAAKESWAALRAPGFCAFWVLAAGLIVFFAVRQPMFLSWDEFSFWGTAGKIVKYTDALYVNAKIGWDWVGTHRPGLIVLGYVFQFFGNYAEWRIMAGYDIFLLSICTLLTAGAKPGEYRRTVPALLFGALVPFLITLYGTIALDTNVYATALSDIPLGMAFGGVLAVYYMDEKRHVWPAALALGALCLLKDTGFALALLAAGILAVDLLWRALAEKRGRRAVGLVLAKVAGLLACCGGAFYVWQAYLSAASAADTSNVGGVAEMGMAQMMLTGTKELLGIGRTEKFSRIMGLMVENFAAVKNTMLGSELVVVALILCMAAAAALLTKDRAVRGQSVRFAVLGLGGFFAFFIFIGFTYVYVFTEAISDTLVGYERYIYPYLLGWLVAAAALVIRAGQNERRPGLLTGGFLAATLLLGGLVCLRLPLNLTVFAGHDSLYAQRRETQSMAAEVQAAVPEDARIFFVSQGDDGNRWFLFTYELYPWYLDYSGASKQGGGGTFALPDAAVPDGTDTLYFHYYTEDALRDTIRASGCDYVFVDRCDALFTAGFAGLFGDGLENCQKQAAVYRWDETAGQFTFVCNVGESA